MDSHSELEIKFFEKGISEHNHYSNLFNNMRFRGWYKFEVHEGFNTHTVCMFRLPPAIPLYDNVLKHFSEEERKAGLHRLLAGKELREEMGHLLDQYNGNINELMATLNEDEVNDLLSRLQRTVTFDCNKIPYLHIKTLRDDPTNTIDIDGEVKKHVLSLPNYLDIFYDVLNETTSIEKGTEISKGIIFNEYIDTIQNKIN